MENGNTALDLRHQTSAQPHGGSITPGNPGNQGGLGYAPSYVRERCRRGFIQRVHHLEAIADNPKSRDVDRIRAISELGRYGLFTSRLDMEEVKARLQRTIAIIEQHCTPDQAEVLLKLIDPIWNPNV